MAGLSTGAGAPAVKVYHEKSMILPDVSRVLACLYEKDVKFETVKDSYKDILRLQATRSVPVPFYDGPTYLQESRAICRYIAETYEQRGYPFLLGKDVLERATIEQWLRHEEHAFDPPSRALFCHLAFPLHDEDIDDIDREKRKLEEVLEVYEQRLGESEFLAGNKFTLADLVHLPNTHHIVTSEKFAYLYDSRKNVQRWWNTISARDSWQQVMRDMKSVEEQYQMEELEEQQQQQWQTEPLATSGGRSIHIDSRQQAGTESRTILVPPPSDGIISSSFFTAPQEQQPLSAETTSQGEPSPIQRKESNFFTTTEKTPSPSKQRTSTTQKSPSSAQNSRSTFFTSTKISQRTDTDISTSEDTPAPTRTSQRSSKEAPDKLHISDFYKASSHTDETATLTKPTPQEALKTSDRISEARQTGEAVAPDKPSPASAKAPNEIAPDEPTQKSTSSVQSTTSTFFTHTDKSTSKGASSPSRPSQGSSKEAPDKLHISDFYKARSHTDEPATLIKPTPQEASKTLVPEARQTSEVDAPHKPSPASAKAPHEIDGPDFYETESKPASADPSVDKPVPYTKPDSQTPKSPFTRPAAQRGADTSGPEAGETPSDHRSVVRTPYAQQRSEQAKKASADQRVAAHLPERVAAKDVQGETAPQARRRDAQDTKEARESDQKRTTSAPSRELPSEYEDTQGAMNEDERFSTKRLRKMLKQSDAEALKSQYTDSQAPPKQEEIPSIYKKPSDVQDRKGQAGNISADGKTDGTPSTGRRAPDTPTSADERRATSPPKGGMAPDDRGAIDPRKSQSINEQQPAPPVPSQSPTTSAWRASASSNGAAQDDDLAQLSNIDQWRYTSTPPIQQGAPGAPSIDKLDKTAGVDRRAQPKKTSTEQSDKSAMDGRAPEMTPGQAPPSDTRHTSASIQEAIQGARGPSDDMFGGTSGTDQMATRAASKQTPARGAVPDVRDTGDDTTKRTVVDKKAASTPPSQEPVSSSQQTAEPIKGATPTSHGITGDDSANIAMADESATPSAPLQSPASDGRSVSTALQGGILDARGKNEAVKPSGADPRDQASDQAPSLPSFTDTRNEKTGLAEASQTTMIGPNEQPGGRAPKNAGAPAAGPLPMKSQKNMNEAYSDGPPIQQLSSDQSQAQPADYKKKQGGDATLVTEFGKSKEDDFLANTKQNNTGQAQATSTDGPSKQQMHSDQNRLISSKDLGKQTNETVYYRSSATSREMLPSAPEKSMIEQQLQADNSNMPPQDNGKQGSEAALLVSGTEQPKKRELLTNADRSSGKTAGEALPKSEEQTSPDTQQVKNNRSNSKSDGSSKPTQFDGNEGDVPESQRGNSSTNPMNP